MILGFNILLLLQLLFLLLSSGLGQNGVLRSVNNLVSLRRRRIDNYRFGAGHICGGALIKINMVLTAAHCFVDQSKYDGSLLPITDFKVIVGNMFRYVRSNMSQSFLIAKRFMMQQQFNLSSYEQDIALLLLDSDAPDAYLSDKDMNNSLNLSLNSRCQLMGWTNRERLNDMDQQIILSVQLLKAKDCMRLSNLTSRHLLPGLKCAVYQSDNETTSDKCSWDTGTALNCEGRLIGIVSWGSKCSKSLPILYTDVAYYKDWLNA
ncbi:maker146, partial [Drosophila busckii]